MARIPKIKELIHTRLANSYGGWIYCEACEKTIGYLCYVTYDSFRFQYQCKCGSLGSLYLSFIEQEPKELETEKLILIKNRLSCYNDQSPLFTILSKNLDYYKYEVTCNTCKKQYVEEKKL